MDATNLYCYDYYCNSSQERLELLLKESKRFSNHVSLKKQLFFMFAIDIYMRQRDRNPFNIKFEIGTNTFCLAPLFDYESSFNSISRVLGYTYRTSFGNLSTIDDYKRLYEKYPIFHKALLEVSSIRLIPLMEQMAQEKNFQLTDSIIELYKKEEEESQKLLQKVL